MPIARVSGVREIAKPILASECLKDDIAPLEPFVRVGRAIYFGAAAGSVTIAALTRSVPLIVAAAVAVVASAVPRYALRAAVAVSAAIVLVTTFEPAFAFRVLAASILAGALFLRATYRAHTGARIALGVGIAMFVASSIGAGRISGIAIGVAAAVSLLGFMNDQTTGGCAWWGGLAIAVATGTLVVAHAPWLVVAGALIAMITASFGAYQLVAQYIAPGERARDHRVSLPPPPANDSE